VPGQEHLRQMCEFSPSEDVTWRDIDGEMVVLNIKTGEYFSFNQVGREIWLAASEGKSFGGVIAQVVSCYDIDEAKARADVEKFLSGLMEHGILRRKVSA